MSSWEDDMMTVQTRYPEARLCLVPATVQIGQSAPTETERWAVYRFGELGEEPLGIGQTAAAAWAEAVRKIKREPRQRAVESYVKNLLAIGFQWMKDGSNKIVDPNDANSFGIVSFDKGSFLPSDILQARHAEWMK